MLQTSCNNFISHYINLQLESYKPAGQVGQVGQVVGVVEVSLQYKSDRMGTSVKPPEIQFDNKFTHPDSTQDSDTATPGTRVTSLSISLSRYLTFWQGGIFQGKA